MSLKLLSEKHGIAESTLWGWKCMGYIVSSTIDNTVMLDEDTVIRLLNAHRTKELSDEYLDKLIKEKDWEREVILSDYDDMLFLLKTHKLYQPLFTILIKELGALITDDRQREIFLAISLGEPITRVAVRYQMTHAQAMSTYSSILRRLGENPGRISSYRKQLMKLRFSKYDAADPTKTPLSELFETHAYCVLHTEMGITTVRELLQYTAQNGWNRLKRIRGMGSITYNHIVNTLYNANFIVVEADGNIVLSPEIAALLI